MNNSMGQHPVLRSTPLTYWPQRLLHMKTMKSHEKQLEDSSYGPSNSVQGPSYAALSYTWGRFRKDGADRLPIDGIPWKTPPVNLDHFTAIQLEQVIQSISRLSDVEYLWLDIACIDMDQLDYADPEVPQQRDIFNASQGFIWLSHTAAPIYRWSSRAGCCTRRRRR